MKIEIITIPDPRIDDILRGEKLRIVRFIGALPPEDRQISQLPEEAQRLGVVGRYWTRNEDAWFDGLYQAIEERRWWADERDGETIPINECRRPVFVALTPEEFWNRHSIIWWRFQSDGNEDGWKRLNSLEELKNLPLVKVRYTEDSDGFPCFGAEKAIEFYAVRKKGEGNEDERD